MMLTLFLTPVADLHFKKAKCLLNICGYNSDAVEKGAN